MFSEQQTSIHGTGFSLTLPVFLRIRNVRVKAILHLDNAYAMPKGRSMSGPTATVHRSTKSAWTNLKVLIPARITTWWSTRVDTIVHRSTTCDEKFSWRGNLSHVSF